MAKFQFVLARIVLVLIVLAIAKGGSDFEYSRRGLTAIVVGVGVWGVIHFLLAPLLLQTLAPKGPSAWPVYLKLDMIVSSLALLLIMRLIGFPGSSFSICAPLAVLFAPVPVSGYRRAVGGTEP